MVEKQKTPQVSVVIPAYNCQDYLQTCLDSIYAQTFTDYEIIIVNDGSTDDTLGVIKNNAAAHTNIVIIDQENHGQGYGRNRALEVARGGYILFVDADDHIVPTTLELTVTRIKKDKSDFVHFDWRYSSMRKKWVKRSGEARFVPFASKDVLVASECDELLQIPHFFSVNNLFRKSFLDKHNIRYGEGYIYEDNVFVTLIANRADKISLLYKPLYVVHRNDTSSTRTGHQDDRHANSFLRAVHESIAVLKPRTKLTAFYLGNYFLNKFTRYYATRVPKQLRRGYLRRFVDAMSGFEITVQSSGQSKRMLRWCVRYGVFEYKKYNEFYLIVIYKVYVLPIRTKITRFLKKHL